MTETSTDKRIRVPISTSIPIPVMLYDLANIDINNISSMSNVITSMIKMLPTDYVLRYLSELGHVPLIALKRPEHGIGPLVLLFENPEVFKQSLTLLDKGLPIWHVIDMLFRKYGEEALPHMLYPPVIERGSSRALFYPKILPPVIVQSLSRPLSEIYSDMFRAPRDSIEISVDVPTALLVDGSSGLALPVLPSRPYMEEYYTVDIVLPTSKTSIVKAVTGRDVENVIARELARLIYTPSISPCITHISRFFSTFRHFSPRVKISFREPTQPSNRIELVSDVGTENTVIINMMPTVTRYGKKTVELSLSMASTRQLKTAPLIVLPPRSHSNNRFLLGIALLREFGKLLLSSGISIRAVRDILQFLFNLWKRHHQHGTAMLNALLRPVKGSEHLDEIHSTTIQAPSPPKIMHINMVWPVAMIVEVSSPKLLENVNLYRTAEVAWKKAGEMGKSLLVLLEERGGDLKKKIMEISRERVKLPLTEDVVIELVGE